MKNFLITYWWVAVTCDWASTISAHSYTVELNPFMREIWRVSGDWGFTLVSLAFGFWLTLMVHLGFKIANKKAIIIAMTLVTSIKLLIALTNLMLIPKSTISWLYNY
jgi:hypothetical protein